MLISTLICLFNQLIFLIYNIQYLLIYLIKFSFQAINQATNYKLIKFHLITLSLIFSNQ